VTLSTTSEVNVVLLYSTVPITSHASNAGRVTSRRVKVVNRFSLLATSVTVTAAPSSERRTPISLRQLSLFIEAVLVAVVNLSFFPQLVCCAVSVSGIGGNLPRVPGYGASQNVGHECPQWL